MISGAVNHTLEATVDLTVRGPAGREERLEFVIDTGFAGDISLHSAVAAALELPQMGGAIVRLADGRAVSSAISQAQVVWNGAVRTVSVDIADNVPMVGMDLLEGHELYIRVIPDGEVRIAGLNGAAPESLER
jgi:clan AA aspartic protease